MRISGDARTGWITDRALPAPLDLGAAWLTRSLPASLHTLTLLSCRDTARNFMPMETLKQTVDGLMYSKMNVVHLHLSDSQSFPLQDTTGHGPNITAHASYSVCV